MIRVFTLLCRRDLDMALVCLGRLEQAWLAPVRLEILDDGTLGTEDWERLRSAFPTAGFHPRREIRERVETGLAHHPACLGYYRNEPLANKLLAVPLIAGGAFRYIDCDILFRRPCPGLWSEDDIPVCLDEPGVYLSNTLPGWLHRSRVPLAVRLNSGLLDIPSGLFDLDRLEWFLARANPAPYMNLLEQTAWASLFATRPHRRVGTATVWSNAAPFPGLIEAPAVHFLGTHKTSFSRFASVPFAPGGNETPVRLSGRAGGAGYVLDREVLRARHRLNRAWRQSSAFRLARLARRTLLPASGASR
jgi:hypothetical protein